MAYQEAAVELTALAPAPLPELCMIAKPPVRGELMRTKRLRGWRIQPRNRPSALLGFLVPFASSDCHMAIQGSKYYPLKGGGVIPVPTGTRCGQDSFQRRFEWQVIVTSMSMMYDNNPVLGNAR